MQTLPLRVFVALFACTLALLVAACGSDDDPQDFDAGTLGAVEIGAGQAIQIRSMLSHTGAPVWAVTPRNAIELAVRDTGDVLGRKVELGEPIDSMCSGAGGKAGALQITADPQRIVGVLGTSCSGAAVTASPLLSGAGLVMISPLNESPGLTSDLSGNAGSDFYPGYFRTANNSLNSAHLVAEFAYRELGLRRMATVDDGDSYTKGLTVAFDDAFRALGGEVVADHRIEKLQTDMTDVLAAIATAEPDGIYFPLFEEEGTRLVEQAEDLSGLEDVTLISDSALLTASFLSTSQSLGIYYAAPAPIDDTNVNEVTGKSRGEVLAAYRAMYGEPEVTYWPHAYDAATLLLSAIESVGVRRGDSLYVDRAALRDAIMETQVFQGLLGTLSCDEFGDCGTGGVSIYHKTDPSIMDPADLDPIYP